MKTSNDRRFPDERGPRPDRNEWKRKQAKEQQEAWRKLTPAQQLASLDNRLGRGEGAVKQRAKIARRMGAQAPVNAPPIEVFVSTFVEETASTGPKKPKAKDRRAAEQAASKVK